MSNNLHLFVEVSQASYDCLTLFYRRNFALSQRFLSVQADAPYNLLCTLFHCFALLCLPHSQQILSFFEMFNICFTFVSHFLMQRY